MTREQALQWGRNRQIPESRPRSLGSCQRTGGFNGAETVRFRKAALWDQGGPLLEVLQWGRNRQIPERERVPCACVRAQGASMGPEPSDSGKATLAQG